MKLAIAAVVMLLSLACIITTAVKVAMGKTALWSGDTIGAFFFHPITMMVAVWLIGSAVRKKDEAPGKGGV